MTKVTNPVRTLRGTLDLHHQVGEAREKAGLPCEMQRLLIGHCFKHGTEATLDFLALFPATLCNICGEPLSVCDCDTPIGYDLLMREREEGKTND